MSKMEKAALAVLFSWVFFMLGVLVGGRDGYDHGYRIGVCEGTGRTWLDEAMTIDGEEVHCIEAPRAAGEERGDAR